MNANELMIGDWVKSNQGSWQWKSTDYLLSEASMSVFEPITLTKEILNANGFLDNGEFPTKDHIKINYKDGWFISFCECYGLEIKYVHELQHALRLCGLTKLADNFKLE